jgi:hypothetical protein
VTLGLVDPIPVHVVVHVPLEERGLISVTAAVNDKTKNTRRHENCISVIASTPGH